MSTAVLNKNVAFEILISTMEKSDFSFLESMFPNTPYYNFNILIINQTSKGKELVSNYSNIRTINTYSKGLSNSRNMAIEKAFGDICLLADDDIEYLPNFENTIQKAFEKRSEASIIRFKIDTFTGEDYKSYPLISRRLYIEQIKSSSSIEIAFKRKPIVAKQILFDPIFGLGSYFPSGEEFLFLKEALRKKLQIYYENKSIVKHKFERSTSNMASNDFIKTKAAIYYNRYKIFGYLGLLKFIIFLYRKGLINLTDIIDKFKVGLNGIKYYKKLKHAKQ